MSRGATDLSEYRRALDALFFPEFAGPKGGGPFVLALEGPNGAGKTTLCRAMAERLGAPHCLGTDEAWIGKAFKTRMIRDAAWYASAMFFLSGCCEQMRVLQQRPEPLVIMDRCLWSTLAVHGAESPERLETLLAMIRPIAKELPVPHLALVLEASFATCQARIARKDTEASALDLLTASQLFHSREQEFYRWLSSQNPHVIFLNVDEEIPEAVTQKAIAALRLHYAAPGHQ